MSESSKPAFSIPAILAIIAAIASFFQGATFGLLLAVAAILLGSLGILLSLSVRKRGGIVSIFSVLAGLIGIIAAIIKAMLYLFG
jgi:uncharacterized membrane protein HdeD (DUF308 family)